MYSMFVPFTSQNSINATKCSFPTKIKWKSESPDIASLFLETKLQSIHCSVLPQGITNVFVYLLFKWLVVGAMFPGV